MKTGKPASKWQENPLLPTRTRVLAELEQQKRFLDILDENEGFMTKSARDFGCSIRTIQRYMLEFSNFAEAVGLIRKKHDQVLLEELEDISYQYAKTPSSVTQRIFLMNALDPDRYRPRQTNIQATSIRIIMGFDSPIAVDRKPSKRVKSESQLEQQP